MNCPSCGAPMRLEAGEECLTCDYCKGIYFPQKDEDGIRVLGEAANASCPVCAIPLMHATIARERIRYCTRCRGMLIAMNTFLVLLQELHNEQPHSSFEVVPRTHDPKELERKIDCPECHQRMDTHFYGGPGNVVIDDCSHCYLNWLDHNELMTIVRAPDRTYESECGVARGAGLES
jgi:Zn-finger nucleic acid-binding protein